MILKFFVIFTICQSVLCHPQTLKLPEIREIQPFEVNSLVQHNLRPRSIAPTADIFSLNNVEDTIKEVEAMLKANPTLPRLTRGEILDLLENITQTDMEKKNLKGTNEETKERDPKAIMVVMPFTPSNGNDVNMQELFTKPPVTHIVGAEPFKTQADYTFKRIPSEISSIPELGTKTPSTSTPVSTASSNAPPQYTAKKTGTRRKRPPTASTNLPTATPSPTTYHPSRRPIRRRPASTERYPNHKYPDEVPTEAAQVVTASPGFGIKIIEAPKFTASDINEDLQMQENQYPGQVENNSPGVANDVNEKKQGSTGSPLLDLVPDNLKSVLNDINSQTKKPLKPSTPPTTSKEKEEEEKIRNMLASFGILPLKTTSTTTHVPDISNVADNLTPEMRDLLMNFGLISDTNEKKDVILSPTTEETYGFNPVKAEVEPEAYGGFKPLPEDDSSRADMEELLARFGLGKNSRKEKSLPKKRDEREEKKDNSHGLNFEVVPQQYMEVLEDIGLADRQGRMIRAQPLAKTQEKQHVFNPGEPQYASSEELEKLNRLLEVVRQLERLNGTVTDEDLKKIDMDDLKELIASLNEENKIVPLYQQDAPNPVNFDFGLEKNEVKRQENSTSTTEAPSTSAAPLTSTEEVQTANLKDLEASFGGQVDSSPVTEEPEESTTEARKTGFYYLVDWNTFLDIDDQKGKRVNLRFQPKVGDPKRFYSVSVP
ncbi:uncharacterized protein LOC108906120 isoform X2 [Anoplophora glabripennis]|uniref:uncharacterized protein LOC108906120 isoform X2 n=1 Tax=Anoplophora glabripennis TaxID=217634 RepID=UPI000874F51C|nr:uncharacterized protein LOC108906120 isoform X2 [Anoplophora glabripennis]